MVGSKESEKEYLARAGSSEWERVKPFSPNRADTLTDSALLLRDFAVAMLALNPAPGDHPRPAFAHSGNRPAPIVSTYVR
jgi:hypothetical protein